MVKNDETHNRITTLLQPDAVSPQLTVSILVPCFNEEKTIENCVEHWINQTRKADQILVVDDCSTDNTANLLQKYHNAGQIQLIRLPKNTGNKSCVQEEGLKHVTSDVFILTDADTIMDKDFCFRVHKAFTKQPNISAFAGYVKSLKYNWLTACREIEYTIGQDLHKTAQRDLGFLFVIAGCAGAFRTNTFKKTITFDHDTFTEDLDFTYKYNKLGLKIYYDKKAIVYTQDPSTLGSYINQMRRWFGGGHLNLIKHLEILSRPNVALELSLMYIEGVIYALLLLFAPIISINVSLFILFFYTIINICSGAYAALRRKRLDLLLFSPMYTLLQFINSYLFIEQFIKQLILKKHDTAWFHPERRAF